jgi:PTS system nitrogen regulatory IIA component
MDLKDILVLESVRYVTGISSKKRLLTEIAQQAETIHGLDSSTVFKALQEREALGSTGVGRGVSIPHARFDDLKQVYGFFTRLEKPIDFDSVDHQPVDLVFTLLAPSTEGAEHLKALALVSRTLRSEATCAKLRANENNQSLFSLLVDQTSVRAA